MRRIGEVIDDEGPMESEDEEEFKEKKEVWDLLGQPSGKFDFKVKYNAPPSTALRRKDIVPSGWGDKFGEEDGTITTLQLLEPVVLGINMWYDSNEKPSVNHVTKSGRVYQHTEKDMVKGKEVAKEFTAKES